MFGNNNKYAVLGMAPMGAISAMGAIEIVRDTVELGHNPIHPSPHTHTYIHAHIHSQIFQPYPLKIPTKCVRLSM